MQRRLSTEANQTLQDIWPSPGLVHYTYIFGGSCTVTEFYQVQNSLCAQVLRSHITAALLHGTRVVSVSQTLRRSAEGATYIRQGGDHFGHCFTYCVSRRRREMYTGHRRLCVSVCPSAHSRTNAWTRM